MPAVREVLHEVDAQKPAHGIHALADLLGATYARDRQTMLVMTAFAVGRPAPGRSSACTACCSIACASGRARSASAWPSGRAAATSSSWVAGHGLRLVLIGLADRPRALRPLRAGGSLAALRGQLRDAASLLAVAILPLTALLVSLHPAWRATRIDAAEVLRRG